MEIVVGISGASGVQYGIRLLQVLAEMDIRTHLVISIPAKHIMQIETGYSLLEVEDLASNVYSEKDFTASIASGSHMFDGMIIAPCSMKTLGSIASGITDNLMTRAADVCLKEGRKLILMTRETPLSRIHLENMLRAHEAGAIILPACPGFYSKPQTIDDLVNIMVGRALDRMGIKNELYERWG
ncbi:MAG TPA: UbiX family flavin prenyltransferase [Methanosarcinaceae archaeon]|nr:UbiX family flavin prenyltransferase [Methanosarcinaceae archaeon]